jgi:hypothetical protein
VQDPASLTILRGGFPFQAITGALAASGTAVAGLDYQPLPAQVEFPAGVLSTTFIVTPLAHTDLTTTATATLGLQPGPGYTVGQPAAASVLIQPSDAPKGTGLTGEYYDHTNSSAYTSGAASFTNVVLKATRLDPAINFTWNTTNLPDPSIPSNITYLVRWTGQVQPQYSEPYIFNTYMADGVRLWVDGKLLVDSWANQSGADRASVPVDLVAGVRYDLRVEFYQSAGTAYAQLSWYSPSQPKQIIPHRPALSGQRPGGRTGRGQRPHRLRAAGLPVHQRGHGQQRRRAGRGRPAAARPRLHRLQPPDPWRAHPGRPVPDRHRGHQRRRRGAVGAGPHRDRHRRG